MERTTVTGANVERQCRHRWGGVEVFGPWMFPRLPRRSGYCWAVQRKCELCGQGERMTVLTRWKWMPRKVRRFVEGK